MIVSKKLVIVSLASLATLSCLPFNFKKIETVNAFENSDFIETEQPELSDETKRLISLYQKNPTEENYLNLRDIVIENYNAVLKRKEEKLDELRLETANKPGGEEIVAEMEEIVQEMYITYWNRINSSMLRFTDSRLLEWKINRADQYEYIPVMGAGESIYIKRTPVTNEEYAEFVQATGAESPENWINGMFPQGEDDFPVTFISYEDAEAYGEWLSEVDGENIYRLPNESEWELAAGHMPKDAEFNCGINEDKTPVDEYEGITRGAHGAIDFWGNVWEWTSTVRSVEDGIVDLAVKGGSWFSDRTECRTEYRGESRNESMGFEDVGFRLIKVLDGEEPEQKVELATLDVPKVTVSSTSDDSITLSWEPVEGAIGYQIFEYFEDTNQIAMLEVIEEVSIVIDDLEPGSVHRYIVQPISYIEIADNVTKENSIEVICGSVSGSMELINFDGINYWLYIPEEVTENMPLIVYLHGINGKGNNPNQLLESEDFVQWLANGMFGNVSAYILIPQVSSNQKDWISMKEKVVLLIQEIIANYPIDIENISLTGFSLGGTGVWNIAASYPNLFKKIAPCSGGVYATRKSITALSDMEIWAFVAMEDTVIDSQSSIQFIDKINFYNSQAMITTFEEATHEEVPSLVYLNKEINLLQWLIG